MREQGLDAAHGGSRPYEIVRGTVEGCGEPALTSKRARVGSRWVVVEHAPAQEKFPELESQLSGCGNGFHRPEATVCLGFTSIKIGLAGVR